MTDINPIPDISRVDDTRARSDRAPDPWSRQDEGNSFARDLGLRRAVRFDLEASRDWARERVFLARNTIEERPLKTAFYAAGIGVLIGLLLRR